MFLMRNKEGNIVKKVATISRKKALESKGYIVISSDNEQPAVEVEVEPAVEVDGQGNVQDTVDPFAKMTIPELKEYAKQNGIDITSSKKDDIIDEIKKALEAENTAGDTELE